jgi:hypothetical protein
LHFLPPKMLPQIRFPQTQHPITLFVASITARSASYIAPGRPCAFQTPLILSMGILSWFSGKKEVEKKPAKKICCACPETKVRERECGPEALIED